MNWIWLLVSAVVGATFAAAAVGRALAWHRRYLDRACSLLFRVSLYLDPSRIKDEIMSFLQECGYYDE